MWPEEPVEWDAVDFTALAGAAGSAGERRRWKWDQGALRCDTDESVQVQEFLGEWTVRALLAGVAALDEERFEVLLPKQVFLARNASVRAAKARLGRSGVRACVQRADRICKKVVGECKALVCWC